MSDKYLIVLFILLTKVLVVLFNGHILFALLGLQALAMVLIGEKLAKEILIKLANIIFLVLACWQILRLFTYQPIGIALINRQSVADIVVIVAAIIVSAKLDKQRLVQFYNVVYGQVFILALLWRELSQFSFNVFLVAVIIELIIFHIVADRKDDQLLYLLGQGLTFILSLLIGIRVLGELPKNPPLFIWVMNLEKIFSFK